MYTTNGYHSTQSSLGHICGNIMYVMERFYVSQYFPKDTFNHIHKATRSMTKEFKRKDKEALNEMVKRPNPILAIYPKLMLNESFQHLEADRMMRPMPYDKDNPFLTQLLQDYESEIRIDFAMRRIRMQFDLNSIWSTELQQLNSVWMLKNSCPENSPIEMNSRIKFPIPKHFMLKYAEDCGFKVEKGAVVDNPAFMDRVNKAAKLPITYEMKTSTGRNEYFCIYKTKFLIVFGGIDMDEGQEVEQIRKNFGISHGLQVDVTVPSILYYIPKKSDFNVDKYIGETKYPDNMVASEGAEYSWLDFKDTITGWNIQSKAGYEISDETEEGDIINGDQVLEETASFRSLIPTNLMTAYEKAKENGIDPRIFMKLYFFKDKKEAPVGDYTVDYDKLTVTVKGEPYRSYVLGLYADTAYVNSIIAQEDGLDNFINTPV